MINTHQNFFQLLDVSEKFEINLEALAIRYRELQVEVHPDRFAHTEESEKIQAVQMSSYLNEAYETLKSPLKRAGYLLNLQDLDVLHAAQDELGMELLLEQMQLREALSELPNDDSALPELAKLKIEVNDKLMTRETIFSQLIDKSDYPQAKKVFHEMQFLHKLLSEIDIGEEQRLGY